MRHVVLCVIGFIGLRLLPFGKSEKKNVDWFEANSLTPLVKEKRTALLIYTTYPNIRNRESLQMVCRKMQTVVKRCAQKYWQDFCDDIQKAADMGDTHRMHKRIENCIGPVRRIVAPLKDLQGNTLRGKQEKLECWVEQYGIIYKAASEINKTVLEKLPQYDVKEHWRNCNKL